MNLSNSSKQAALRGWVEYYNQSSLTGSRAELIRVETASQDFGPDRVLVKFKPGSPLGVTITHEGDAADEDQVWGELLKDILLCGISHLNGTPHPYLRPYTGPVDEDGNPVKQTQHPDDPTK